jgi:hypothetical protein
VHLSSIADVGLASDGTVYVLNDGGHQLLAFSQAGHLVGKADLRDKHGEAIAGLRLATSGGNRVWIYAPLASTIHVYDLRAGRLTERTAFGVLPETAKDFCVLGDTAYVLAYQRGQILHAYTLQGRLIRSFGEAPGGSSQLKSAIVGAGAHVACLPSGLIVADFAATDMVSAFRSNGTAVWRYTVPDFRGIETLALPGGGIRFRVPTGSWDAMASVFGIGSGLVAVQIARKEETGIATETILLEARDGRHVGTQLTIPRVRRGNALAMIGRETGPLRTRVYYFRLNRAVKR